MAKTYGELAAMNLKNVHQWACPADRWRLQAGWPGLLVYPRIESPALLPGTNFSNTNISRIWGPKCIPRCGYQCVPSIVGFCAAFLYSHSAVVRLSVTSTAGYFLASLFHLSLFFIGLHAYATGDDFLSPLLLLIIT